MNASERIRAIGVQAFALVAALVALTLIINLPWFDEDLEPELARLAQPQPVSLDGNAFPFQYGFAAADNLDPHAAGVEIIEIMRARYRADEQPTVTREEIDDILGNPPNTDLMQRYSPSYAACDSRRELDCTERLIEDIARADVDDERLDLLLNRFETMLSLGRFEEIKEMNAYSPFPSYGPIMAVSRIRLAIDFENTPTDLLLERIGSNVRFWKLMLRDSETLLSAMIALAGLRDSMRFLPALMRTRELSPMDLARIAEVLTPLSADERDIGDAFLGETGFVMRGIFASGDSAAGWAWLLTVQKNATMNAYYARFTAPMRQRAVLSAAEFYAQLARKTESYRIPLLPPPLYNLGGKYLFLRTMPEVDAMSDYISRIHDVDGTIALVLLQAEILANPDVPIERVVGRSQYRNPYTQEPMDYNAASGTLGFECLERRRGICAIAIGRD